MSDFGIQPVSKKYFDELGRHEVYYRGRWGYYSVAQQMVMSQNPKSLLEIGAPQPIFVNSDTLNLSWDGSASISHDITVIPWPVEDKHYDFVVALQVWEHIGPHQENSFREVIRVCNKAVLSFPLDWKGCKPDDDHHNVTEAVISKWTLGITPIDRKVVGSRFKRLILLFDFESN